ncbi:hypothetical protein [Candidatus Poriferisocius sp.]|uniref:hypothetical protein n=1 Tax=Candidatus Poriferisocius sp. TaxID=3101276 RepID=UPI003B024626
MTASVTICNTSNHTGENCTVKLGLINIPLKPGEYTTVHIDDKVEVFFDKDGKTEPFTMNGKQMYPEASIAWRPFGKVKK